MELEELLQNFKMKKNGEAGLLATEGLLVPASEKVPLYSVEDISDSATLTALFRDLTFWASSYLLEPCDFNFKKTKAYGLGRERLPKNIAIPLVEVSKKIGAAHSWNTLNPTHCTIGPVKTLPKDWNILIWSLLEPLRIVPMKLDSF